MEKIRLAAALAVISISSTAMAQQHKSPMENLDSDGNGSVSFAEFQEGGFDVLARLDLDQNGVLSLDEFINGRPHRGPRRGGDDDVDDQEQTNEERRAQRQARMLERATEAFQEMDRDGDELVTASEFQEASFLRMDRDNNGVLSDEELRPPRGPRGHRRGGERTPPA